MKRIFSFLLAVTLLLSMSPLPAQAEETAISRETFTVTADPGLPDNEELYAAYASQVLYGLSPAPHSISAGSQLSGDLQILYDSIVPILHQIAEGKRKETTIRVGTTFHYMGETYVPDVEAAFSGSSITSEELYRLIIALLSDLPYDLYWYDKTSGCSMEVFSGKTLLCVNLKFSVAGNYAAGPYAVNTEKTSAASKAVANAQYIVQCYADTSDYNKLVGYSDAICNLVSYDRAAASKGSYAADNDPWQLIHVFDGNSGTKAVCEGYAKAYLYLCHLSEFQDDVQCYTVSGTTEEGSHMWNIVTLQGKNYLVDVSSTDTGSYENRLLLTGCTGNLSSGYKVAKITYRYDNITKSFWGTGIDSILNLSKTACPPDWSSNHSHSYTGWSTSLSATHARIGIKHRVCKKCGFLDSSCSSALKMAAPSLKLYNDSTTGYPKLSWKTVTGANAYRIYRATSKTGSYKLIETTEFTDFIDTDTTAGKKYFYKVIAADTENYVTSGASGILNRVCDLPQPAISVTVNSETGKPVIEWETVDGAAKYYIYRATSSNGSYKHIKSAISARSYTDTSAKAGTTYYYKIKAIHKNTDATSAYSDYARQMCILPQPKVTGKLNSSGNPYLSWKQITDAKGYEIFRSDSENGEYISIGTRTTLKFADTKAEAGIPYFYKVRALHKNASATSILSSAVEITVPVTEVSDFSEEPIDSGSEATEPDAETTDPDEYIADLGTEAE
jgi:fibronectin type 3 domain-containing protein